MPGALALNLVLPRCPASGCSCLLGPARPSTRKTENLCRNNRRSCGLHFRHPVLLAGLAQSPPADLQDKDAEALLRYGGVEGICTALASSSTAGISEDAPAPSLRVRQQHFGWNRFRPVPMKGFFRLLYENLQDPTLLLLMSAALVRHPPEHRQAFQPHQCFCEGSAWMRFRLSWHMCCRCAAIGVGPINIRPG